VKAAAAGPNSAASPTATESLASGSNAHVNAYASAKNAISGERRAHPDIR
jgi:hypothetical protein